MKGPGKIGQVEVRRIRPWWRLRQTRWVAILHSESGEHTIETNTCQAAWEVGAMMWDLEDERTRTRLLDALPPWRDDSA